MARKKLERICEVNLAAAVNDHDKVKATFDDSVGKVF